MVTVGILALQGDFEAHQLAFARCGAITIEVRQARDLQYAGALVIPGGESTTMLKLLHGENMMEPLREFGKRRPIFGTCAGAILLAREVQDRQQDSLGLMDITVERNAYGRQLQSCVARIDGDMEAVFIRAPIIRRIGRSVKVHASYGGTPVWVEDGMHMAATFHPELTSDNRVHSMFLSKVEQWHR
jgi:5'-phosphate synthase pdxT subunit